MKIFIDTNTFINNWYLRSPNFQLFINFVNNTNSNLMISKLVCEEVENKFQIGIDETKSEINQAARKAGNYCKEYFHINIEQFPKEQYVFLDIINENFEKAYLIPYDRVQHSTIVKKSISGIRPFRKNEKGYRDALIWHSFLEYLAKNEINGKIAFISENKSDFFDYVEHSCDFHKDLKFDIEANLVECELIPYNSLQSFIKAEIDELLHKVQHDDIEDIEERFGEQFEESAQEHTYYHMNALSIHRIKNLFNVAGYSPSVLQFIRDFNFDIFEGLEDPEILNISKISKDRIYIEYSYNLRICNFRLELTSSEYYSNKNELDSIFHNAETDGDETSLYAYMRCYYFSNIIFNILDETVEQFEIKNIEIL